MSLRDQLLKAGLASETSAKKEPEGEGRGPSIPVDFSTVPEWALKWARAGVELFGRKQLAQLLETAIAGNRAGAEAFDSKVERALDRLPISRANEIRPEIPSLFLHRGKRKGVPTFCENASVVSTALESGAYDAWLKNESHEESEAESLEIPQPKEAEELETYQGRLIEWASDKHGALLKRLGFDVYRLVKAEQDRREAEKAQIESQILADAEKRLVTGLAGTFLLALACLKQVVEELIPLLSKGIVGYDQAQRVVRRAVLGSPWPWSLKMVWGNEHNISLDTPTKAPSYEDATTGELGDAWILKSVRAYSSGSPLVGEVQRRWPCAVNQVWLLVHGENQYAVKADGTVDTFYGEGAGGVCSTQPNPTGWWHTKSKKWCGGELWQTLQYLRQATRGMVYFSTETVRKYSRHPDKGYPRLRWAIVAGGRSDSFELPLQQGELVRRMEAIKSFQDAQIMDLIPEDAYWIDCRLGQTQAGKPRLDNGRPNSRATVVHAYARAMSQGRHGWAGSTVHSRSHGGADVLWNSSVTSSGGGLVSSCVVAWIPEGQTLALSSGKGVTFDGTSVQEIAGAGLTEGEDPSKN